MCTAGNQECMRVRLHAPTPAVHMGSACLNGETMGMVCLSKVLSTWMRPWKCQGSCMHGEGCMWALLSCGCLDQTHAVNVHSWEWACHCTLACSPHTLLNICLATLRNTWVGLKLWINVEYSVAILNISSPTEKVGSSAYLRAFQHVNYFFLKKTLSPSKTNKQMRTNYIHCPFHGMLKAIACLLKGGESKTGGLKTDVIMLRTTYVQKYLWREN